MTIKLIEVRNILQDEIFHSKYDKEFSFLPRGICDWAIKSNLQLEFYEIELWKDFEYGEVDFDDNDFEKLVFGGNYSLNTEVLLITDESLKNNIAFRFRIGAFKDFVNYYEEIFDMDFFQPEDYIVFLRDYKEVKIIHHEGKMIKFRRTN